MAASNLPASRSSTRSHNRMSGSSVRQAILLITSFLFGLVVCSAFFLWYAHNHDPLLSTSQYHHLQYHWRDNQLQSQRDVQSATEANSIRGETINSSSILDGLRVLVTIASFDFMQLAHLEEVLDGFQDLCYAGSMVDIVVYTTVMVSGYYSIISFFELQRIGNLTCWLNYLSTKYPVALIDMFNDRMRCNNPSPNAGLTMTLMLKHPRVRLHLVDFHRELFYDRIDQYDLFIYTEVRHHALRLL